MLEEQIKDWNERLEPHDWSVGWYRGLCFTSGEATGYREQRFQAPYDVEHIDGFVQKIEAGAKRMGNLS